MKSPASRNPWRGFSPSSSYSQSAPSEWEHATPASGILAAQSLGVRRHAHAPQQGLAAQLQYNIDNWDALRHEEDRAAVVAAAQTMKKYLDDIVTALAIPSKSSSR